VVGRVWRLSDAIPVHTQVESLSHAFSVGSTLCQAPAWPRRRHHQPRGWSGHGGVGSPADVPLLASSKQIPQRAHLVATGYT